MDVDFDGSGIITNHLGIQYDNGKWGIQNVSIHLMPGQFVALIGHNGAGKSTLIHSLCGVLKPTEGSVRYSSTLVTKGAPFRSIGWSSQKMVIDWYLSVEDNIMLGARLAGFTRAEAREATSQLLDLLGLAKLKHHKPDALSGGQQQRIQIARALVYNPSIVILDEPTTGLDPETSELLLQFLDTKSKQGKIVVVSSHDLSLLERYCDDVLLLSDGRVVSMEKKDDFLSKFASLEVLCIEYQGNLPDDFIKEFEKIGYHFIRKTPLELEIPRGSSIGSFISSMEKIVDVLDVKRNQPGLREAYMKFSISRGGRV